MANAKKKPWSYRTGEKGANRVRAYEKGGTIFLEFYERSTEIADPVRQRISLRSSDREEAKLKADELAAALRRREPPPASKLTLYALFENWYLKEVTPGKSKGKQRHDFTAAEMLLRCYGRNREPRTLNVRDVQKFIRERRSGVLRPASVDEAKKPIRPVSDRQICYDLKFLHAVLNYATQARDDAGVPLLAHNPLKGLPLPTEDNPRRPMLNEERYMKMREVAAEVHPLCEPFLVVVHETGHRAASVRQLRWSDIDLAGRTVTWRAETDKIGFTHVTPLSEPAVAALARLQKAQGAIGTTWVFPAIGDTSRALRRETATKWWGELEARAELERVPGMGFHSVRRKFASELKEMPLRDLAHLGGWKNPQTVLTVYQQPSIELQRRGLATRKPLAASA